jgi:hypothetical protein
MVNMQLFGAKTQDHTTRPQVKPSLPGPPLGKAPDLFLLPKMSQLQPTPAPPSLPLLHPLHLTGQEQTRLFVPPSGDRGGAIYANTHGTLPLPNFFLCMLLLRLSLKAYAF